MRSLKGIGEKTEKLFAKVGVSTLRQLLHYYPREYDQYTSPVSFAELRAGGRYAVRTILPHSVSVKGNQRKSVILLELSEGNVRLLLTWFNMPFLRSTLKKGET